MKIEIGKKGIDLTWQKDFPETTECECEGQARLAFVAKESDTPLVCSLHDNEGRGGWWPHDAIAVAIYFCQECFKASVIWNQA